MTPARNSYEDWEDGNIATHRAMREAELSVRWKALDLTGFGMTQEQAQSEAHQAAYMAAGRRIIEKARGLI